MACVSAVGQCGRRRGSTGKHSGEALAAGSIVIGSILLDLFDAMTKFLEDTIRPHPNSWVRSVVCSSLSKNPVARTAGWPLCYVRRGERSQPDGRGRGGARRGRAGLVCLKDLPPMCKYCRGCVKPRGQGQGVCGSNGQRVYLVCKHSYHVSREVINQDVLCITLLLPQQFSFNLPRWQCIIKGQICSKSSSYSFLDVIWCLIWVLSFIKLNTSLINIE